MCQNLKLFYLKKKKNLKLFIVCDEIGVVLNLGTIV